MNNIADYFSLKDRVILLEKKLQNSYCNNYKIRKKLNEIKKREITKSYIAKILISLKKRLLLDMNYKAIARECSLTPKTVLDISHKMNKEMENGMNIGSIYPNGFEKTRPCNTCNHTIDKDVKQQALTMLKENKSIKFVCKKLNLQHQTVLDWKSAESKERY